MNMKHLLPILLAASFVMLEACEEKKKSTDIITTKYVPKKPQPPIAMPAESMSNTVQWMGQSYTVKVDRTPADSLALVKDENHQPYIDNYVKVVVLRQDGSELFKQTFTKTSFSDYIDDTFRKNGILAGIRFDEVETAGLEFSVVIALPDAVDDVFVPLDLVIDRQGHISITRDDDMDMLDYDDRLDVADDEMEEE